jgi:hypothetical protein
MCSITTKLSSHTSRYSFSDLSRRLGSSIYDISLSLNHHDLNTTQSYFKSRDYQSVETANKSFYNKLDQEFVKTKAHSKK